MIYTTEEVIDLHKRYTEYLRDNDPTIVGYGKKVFDFVSWINKKTRAHNRIGNTSLGNQIRDIENGNIVER